MEIVRLVAYFMNGGVSANNKIIVLCGIENGTLQEGEWFGYEVINNRLELPFILRDGSQLHYGGREKTVARTNLGQQRIAVGERFNIEGAQSNREESACKCFIKHVTNVTNIDVMRRIAHEQLSQKGVQLSPDRTTSINAEATVGKRRQKAGSKKKKSKPAKKPSPTPKMMLSWRKEIRRASKLAASGLEHRPSKRLFTDWKKRTWLQVRDPLKGWLPTKPPTKTAPRVPERRVNQRITVSTQASRPVYLSGKQTSPPANRRKVALTVNSSATRMFTDSKNRTWRQTWDSHYGWLPTKPPTEPSSDIRNRPPREAPKKSFSPGGAKKTSGPAPKGDAEARLRQFARSTKGQRLLRWFKQRDRRAGGVRAIVLTGGGIETNRRKH